MPWSSISRKVRCQNAITQQEQFCKRLGTCRRSIHSEDSKLLCGSAIFEAAVCIAGAVESNRQRHHPKVLVSNSGAIFFGNSLLRRPAHAGGLQGRLSAFFTTPDAFLRQPFELSARATTIDSSTVRKPLVRTVGAYFLRSPTMSRARSTQSSSHDKRTLKGTKS